MKHRILTVTLISNRQIIFQNHSLSILFIKMLNSNVSLTLIFMVCTKLYFIAGINITIN